MKAFFRKHREILSYLFFGAATTAVNWIVYVVLQWTTDWNMDLCNGIAWCAAVIFAFVTNKLLVFQSRKTDGVTLLREVLSFLGARVLSGVLEVFLPGLLCRIGLDGAFFGIGGAVAKAVTTAIVILLNYATGKWIVFRKKS